MSLPELTNTQALMSRYYREEKDRQAKALTRASLNLQLDANDLAMLNTIAKRFNKSRDELAKDVLSHALIDLLTQVEPGERKLLARDADEMASTLAQEIADENGLKDIDHKPNIWTLQDRNISKLEKKRAKQLATSSQIQAEEEVNDSTSALDSTSTPDIMPAPPHDSLDASLSSNLNSNDESAIEHSSQANSVFA